MKTNTLSTFVLLRGYENTTRSQRPGYFDMLLRLRRVNSQGWKTTKLVRSIYGPQACRRNAYPNSPTRGVQATEAFEFWEDKKGEPQRWCLSNAEVKHVGGTPTQIAPPGESDGAKRPRTTRVGCVIYYLAGGTPVLSRSFPSFTFAIIFKIMQNPCRASRPCHKLSTRRHIGISR